MTAFQTRAGRIHLAILVGVALGGTATARAGDVTLFFVAGFPSDTWGTGYGGALGSTWFDVIRLEADLARVPGDRPEQSMTSLSGTVALAPNIGKLTPYAGVGVGVFRQADRTFTDNGTVKALVVGLKVKIQLLVLKAEYRRLDLGSTPLIPMDHRVSVGGGIAF